MYSDLFRDENTVLHAASGKLTQATTPADQLEAVSGYARSRGAACGILFHLDDQELQQEVVACWVRGGVLAPKIGERFDTPDFARMVSPMQPALFADAPQETLLSPPSRAFTAQYRMRGLAVLPLYNKGRWIGVILFAWDTPQRFDARDRHVYAAFQRQAAPVIDALRLYEQAQRRADELEKAKNEIDILYAISSRMARASTPYELLDVASGYARDHGAKSCMLLYVRAAPPLYLEVVEALADDRDVPEIGTRFDTEYGIIRQLQSSRDLPILLEDVQTAPRLDETTRQAYLDCGRRASALLPLSNRGRWIGALIFNWDAPHPFGDRDRRVYTALIQQASPIVDSIRLQAETETARQQAELVAQINAALLQATDEQAILSSVSLLARRYGASLSLLAYTDHASRLDIVALDSGGKSPIPAGILPITTFSPQDYPLLNMTYAYPGDVLFIENSATDPRTADPRTQAFAQAVNWAASILIPLKSADQWQGILAFAWETPQTFDADTRKLFNAIRPTAASVVTGRRAYLAEEAARRETEQRARALAALEERTRLARELHDSVSQALYGIGLGARTARTLLDRDPARLAEPLDYILSLVEAGLTEMRALIFELRPESLEQEGLVSVLTKQAASLQARHGVAVRTSFCDEPPLRLEIKESLYRIAREALHNTIKHARATQVELSLTHDAEGYQLEIADNGLGFDPSGTYPGHLGLKSMRERTTALNGMIYLSSAPGKGTRIRVRIPNGEGLEAETDEAGAD